MTLPNLPEPAMVHVDAQGYSTPCYTSEQMMQFRAETVGVCAAVCRDMSPAEYATGKVDHNEMSWSDSCCFDIQRLLI